MPAVHCAGCNRTFSNPKYRRSHLSQTRNPACLAVKQALLAPDPVLEALSPSSSEAPLPPSPEVPPPSPPQQPAPGDPTRLMKMAPTPTGHGQTDPGGTLGVGLIS